MPFYLFMLVYYKLLFSWCFKLHVKCVFFIVSRIYSLLFYFIIVLDGSDLSLYCRVVHTCICLVGIVGVISNPLMDREAQDQSLRLSVLFDFSFMGLFNSAVILLALACRQSHFNPTGAQCTITIHKLWQWWRWW